MIKDGALTINLFRIAVSLVRLLFVTSFVINVQIATSSYCSFLTHDVSQMRTSRIAEILKQIYC